MFGRLSRRLFSASLLVALASCSTLGIGGSKDPATDVSVAPQPGAAGTAPVAAAGQAYVAGKCPQVVIRDENSVYQNHGKGAKDDPKQLVFQASLVQATRQCTVDGTNMGITVVVQGRLVGGPMGNALGTVSVPIRVSVMDDDKTLYSDVTNYQITVPPGETTTQFLYTDNKVSVTGGSGGYTNVYVGFDDASAKTDKTAKPNRKKK